MAKGVIQGPTSKPLSAWERRRMYSQLLNVRVQRTHNATAQDIGQRGSDDKENVSAKKRRQTTAFCRRPDTVIASKAAVPLRKPAPPNGIRAAVSTGNRPICKVRKTTSAVKNAELQASPIPGPSKETRPAIKPSDRPAAFTKVRKAMSAAKNTVLQPSSSNAAVQTKNVVDSKPFSKAPKPKTTATKAVKERNNKGATKQPVASSSSAKPSCNMMQGLSGRSRLVLKPATKMTSRSSCGAAYKLASNLKPAPKSEQMSGKPAKPSSTLKNSTSRSLHSRKSVLPSKLREASKGKRVSMKMTPETVPPCHTRDDLTPEAAFPTSSDAADEKLNRKLSRCAGSTPYRQSIMKKSTPRNCISSTRKSKSRVSFKSPAEIAGGNSFDTSVKLTPPKESPPPNTSPGATPYRSAEESITMTNSSTDDVYQTPYVEHSVKIPDAEAELKKSAGSTPFRLTLDESNQAPDETVKEELNSTFTMEDDDEEPGEDTKVDNSMRQPLSCLKSNNNVTQTRKLVSFAASPKKRSATPLRKTPHKSNENRSHLVSWLEKHGHSISSYRHLHCLGADIDDLTHKPHLIKRARKSTPKACSDAKKSLRKDSGASPYLQPSGSKQNARKEDTSDIAGILKELYSLLKNNYPSDQVNKWLDTLESDVVQSYPGYWMCRSLACENLQDFPAALNWLVQGLEYMKSADKEMLQELDLLVNRVSAKENVNPGALGKPDSKKVKARDVSPANIFESTRLDYAIFEANHIDRISAAATGRKSESHAVMTPVRRSTRRHNRGSRLDTPSAILLFKNNPALN